MTNIIFELTNNNNIKAKQKWNNIQGLSFFQVLYYNVLARPTLIYYDLNMQFQFQFQF